MSIASSFVARMRQTVSVIIITCFITTTCISPAQAQTAMNALNTSLPGSMLNVSPAFQPVLIKGVNLSPTNPLEFDFIVDRGDADLEGEAYQAETMRLVKYFLAALTTDEKDMWVNLSPYEKDRMISSEFGATEMGRDLLAQDYLLKQLTSSLIYPDSELGAQFWDTVYQKAFKEFGTTDVPTDTFHKVWIVPGKADIYEHEKGAFVVESRMKVMLAADYEAERRSHMSQVTGHTEEKDQKEIVSFPRKRESQNSDTSMSITGSPLKTRGDDTMSISTDIMRSVILPAIEKEINTGENFAPLRQIYNSIILASWYKLALKESVLSKIYVNQSKTDGVDLKTPQDYEQIYQQYLDALKKGVYNYIKEDVDPITQETTPRKYFSGGSEMDAAQVVTAGRMVKGSSAFWLNHNRIERAREGFGEGDVFGVTLEGGDNAMTAQEAVVDVDSSVDLYDYVAVKRPGQHIAVNVYYGPENPAQPMVGTVVENRPGDDQAYLRIKVDGTIQGPIYYHASAVGASRIVSMAPTTDVRDYFSRKRVGDSVSIKATVTATSQPQQFNNAVLVAKNVPKKTITIQDGAGQTHGPLFVSDMLGQPRVTAVVVDGAMVSIPARVRWNDGAKERADIIRILVKHRKALVDGLIESGGYDPRQIHTMFFYLDDKFVFNGDDSFHDARVAARTLLKRFGRAEGHAYVNQDDQSIQIVRRTGYDYSKGGNLDPLLPSMSPEELLRDAFSEFLQADLPRYSGYLYALNTPLTDKKIKEIVKKPFMITWRDADGNNHVLTSDQVRGLTIDNDQGLHDVLLIKKKDSNEEKVPLNGSFRLYHDLNNDNAMTTAAEEEVDLYSYVASKQPGQHIAVWVKKGQGDPVKMSGVVNRNVILNNEAYVTIVVEENGENIIQGPIYYHAEASTKEFYVVRLAPTEDIDEYFSRKKVGDAVSFDVRYEDTNQVETFRDVEVLSTRTVHGAEAVFIKDDQGDEQGPFFLLGRPGEDNVVAVHDNAMQTTTPEFIDYNENNPPMESSKDLKNLPVGAIVSVRTNNDRTLNYRQVLEVDDDRIVLNGSNGLTQETLFLEKNDGGHEYVEQVINYTVSRVVTPKNTLDLHQRNQLTGGPYFFTVSHSATGKLFQIFADIKDVRSIISGEVPTLITINDGVKDHHIGIVSNAVADFTLVNAVYVGVDHMYFPGLTSLERETAVLRIPSLAELNAGRRSLDNAMISTRKNPKILPEQLWDLPLGAHVSVKTSEDPDHVVEGWISAKVAEAKDSPRSIVLQDGEGTTTQLALKEQEGGDAYVVDVDSYSRGAIITPHNINNNLLHDTEGLYLITVISANYIGEPQKILTRFTDFSDLANHGIVRVATLSDEPMAIGANNSLALEYPQLLNAERVDMGEHIFHPELEAVLKENPDAAVSYPGVGRSNFSLSVPHSYGENFWGLQAAPTNRAIHGPLNTSHTAQVPLRDVLLSEHGYLKETGRTNNNQSINLELAPKTVLELTQEGITLGVDLSMIVGIDPWLTEPLDPADLRRLPFGSHVSITTSEDKTVEERMIVNFPSMSDDGGRVHYVTLAGRNGDEKGYVINRPDGFNDVPGVRSVEAYTGQTVLIPDVNTANVGRLRDSAGVYLFTLLYKTSTRPPLQLFARIVGDVDSERRTESSLVITDGKHRLPVGVINAPGSRYTLYNAVRVDMGLDDETRPYIPELQRVLKVYSDAEVQFPTEDSSNFRLRIPLGERDANEISKMLTDAGLFQAMEARFPYMKYDVEHTNTDGFYVYRGIPRSFQQLNENRWPKEDHAMLVSDLPKISPQQLRDLPIGAMVSVKYKFDDGKEDVFRNVFVDSIDGNDVRLVDSDEAKYMVNIGKDDYSSEHPRVVEVLDYSITRVFSSEQLRKNPTLLNEGEIYFMKLTTPAGTTEYIHGRVSQDYMEVKRDGARVDYYTLTNENGEYKVLLNGLAENDTERTLNYAQPTDFLQNRVFIPGLAELNQLKSDSTVENVQVTWPALDQPDFEFVVKVDFSDRGAIGLEAAQAKVGRTLEIIRQRLRAHFPQFRSIEINQTMDTDATLTATIGEDPLGDSAMNASVSAMPKIKPKDVLALPVGALVDVEVAIKGELRTIRGARIKEKTEQGGVVFEDGSLFSGVGRMGATPTSEFGVGKEIERHQVTQILRYSPLPVLTASTLSSLYMKRESGLSLETPYILQRQVFGEGDAQTEWANIFTSGSNNQTIIRNGGDRDIGLSLIRPEQGQWQFLRAQDATLRADSFVFHLLRVQIDSLKEDGVEVTMPRADDQTLSMKGRVSFEERDNMFSKMRGIAHVIKDMHSHMVIDIEESGFTADGVVTFVLKPETSLETLNEKPVRWVGDHALVTPGQAAETSVSIESALNAEGGDPFGGADFAQTTNVLDIHRDAEGVQAMMANLDLDLDNFNGFTARLRYVVPIVNQLPQLIGL